MILRGLYAVQSLTLARFALTYEAPCKVKGSAGVLALFARAPGTSSGCSYGRIATLITPSRRSPKSL
jgi:hypothetical protein